MMELRPSDTVMVINGPEDGAEFPIARAPLEIGSDSSCAVLLQLDDSVAPHHARMTVDASGYRVRALGPATVLVDGKRAGLVRSRIASNGSYVQIGNTMLAVSCACDGLASRSRGVAPGSDLIWLLRFLGTHGWKVSRRALRYVTYGIHRILSRWFTVLIILGILWFFVPGFRGWVNYAWRWFRFYILLPLFG